MNRFDFQRLAKIRIKEAEVLLEKGHFDGAYYLAGYAVECALKACIAKQTRQYDFPEKAQVLESYTHDLAKLVRAAKLENELEEKISVDRDFAAYWRRVQAWSEAARYKITTPEQAQNLYGALTDRENGVFSWLQKFW